MSPIVVGERGGSAGGTAVPLAKSGAEGATFVPVKLQSCGRRASHIGTVFIAFPRRYLVRYLREGDMEVIHLPAGRLHGPVAERSALRQGIAGGPAHVRVVKRAKVIEAQPDYCDGCARPIDFGAVLRGTRVYCSVECLLGGSRPPA